jgi:hypothetical protein
MTSAEYQSLFFSTIGRAPGQPADDYELVLGSSGIPAGLGPYVVPDASMPFSAMTQQIGTDGRIAGRIFLPTATPDDLGYYAHPFSPLRDGPTPGSLLWEWRDLGGPPVVTPGEASGTVPPDDSELAARVTALEEVSAAMGEEQDDLVQRVTAIEAALANGLHAHGPINLPIVLESLTSLRCKGDIDVAVKPGQATPPDMSADDPPDAATIAILRRLITDGDEAES